MWSLIVAILGHTYIHLVLEKAGCFVFLSSRCIVTINVLWLFLTVPWVGLQYVTDVFSDHTFLLFALTRLPLSIKS